MVIVGLMLGMLLAALDQTIISTAMPTIIGELGGFDKLTWMHTSYLLASTAIVPAVGKLSDIYGRRLWYLIGIAVFIAGSILCGTADTMVQLIIFRGLQGLGGGMLMPISQTIIGDLFPGVQRAKIQGFMAGTFGFASIMGPKLGGWIVDFWNWRWAFWINLPLGILAAAVVARGLKETKGAGPRSIDYWGSITMTAGVSALLLALVEGGHRYAWSSPQILGLFTAAAALLVLFLWIESKAADPVIKLGLFRNRIFAVANAVVFLMGLGMFGSLVFIPLFMQGVIGVSASAAGTVLTPMMLGMIAASSVGGRLLYRVGYRAQLVSGMAIMAFGFFLMSTLDLTATLARATAYMVVTGLGLGLVLPTTLIAVQNTFPASQRGMVTSAVSFFRSIGGTLGVTVLGAVMNVRAKQEITARLADLPSNLPASLAPALEPIRQSAAGDPGALFGLLLKPELLAKVPEPARPALVNLLKASLAASLHTVFLAGLGLALLGLTVSFFIGPGLGDSTVSGGIPGPSGEEIVSEARLQTAERR